MTPERIAELVARWVRSYTRDLPTPIAQRRIDEIDADLHDHIAHERAKGTGEWRIAGGRHWPKALLQPVIPAYLRSTRKHQDRPVTPKVAGSSPVAPVKSLQTGGFCWPEYRQRPPASLHPALIPRRK